MPRVLRWLLLLVALGTPLAWGQGVAIPLGEVTSRSEEALARVAEIQEAAGADRTEETIAAELRSFTREIEGRIAQNRRAVARTASIDTLNRIEHSWTRLSRTLESWSDRLAERVARIEADTRRLDEMAGVWRATLEEGQTDAAPPELNRRIKDLLAQMAATRQVLERERSKALGTQARVAVQQARIADVIASTRRARRDIEDHLLVRDSDPLWLSMRGADSGRAMVAETTGTLLAQWAAVNAYSERQPGQFLAHGLLFVALAFSLLWMRGRVRRKVEEVPALAPAASVFELPVAMALVLSIFGGFGLYPDAPVLWLALLGALALIPAIAILRRLMERDVLPVFYALVLFYFIDQVRIVSAPVALLPRVVFVAELLAAAGVAGWLAQRTRTRAAGATESRRHAWVRNASRVSLAVALVAALCNVSGFVALSNLLGNALFSCAYVGLMLYALVEILASLFALMLHARAFERLGAIRNNRALLVRRFTRGMEWLAVALLALFLLERLALRERLFGLAGDWLAWEAVIGSLHVSLGDVLAFAAALWASFIVSRFLRFLLEEEVFPRFTLGRGLPYAISTTLHYAVIIVGFVIAVGALGVDMTKLTILAGAFTVGIGFGLQNIFNNFVSGLILLFERPIKVGDVIQIDDVQGLVERIGIRASTVRVSSGPELIVPNGKLISERVVNWTLHGLRRSVEIPFAVVSHSDWKTALVVLERVGGEHPMVLKDPAPHALVTRMGPDWWALDLRVWTDHPGDWMEIRSDIAVAAAEALKAAGIVVK